MFERIWKFLERFWCNHDWVECPGNPDQMVGANFGRGALYYRPKMVCRKCENNSYIGKFTVSK